MIHSAKDIDQATRSLLQRATVKTPSREFVPRLMKMIEQENSVRQKAQTERLIREKKPFLIYLITGICLAIPAGFIFLLSKGVLSDVTFVPDVMQTLSGLLAGYYRNLYLFLHEYFLIPIVINAICLLILIDRLFRKRIRRII